MDTSVSVLRQVLVPRSLHGQEVAGIQLVIASLELWQAYTVINISCSSPREAAAVPGLVLEDHLGTAYGCTSVLRAGPRLCQIFEPAVAAGARSLTLWTPDREGTTDGIRLCSVSVAAAQPAAFHAHGRIRVNSRRTAAFSGPRP